MELLVATALVIVVTSAVAALALPMRRAFDRGVSAGEQASRGRTAMHAIVSELRNAGSGVVIGPAGVALEDVISVVTVVPPSTVTMARASGPQGLTRHRVDAGEMSVRLDPSEPCSEQDATCGIRAGDVVAIFDLAKGETVGVSGVNTGSGTLHLSSPLRNAFGPGAVIAAIVQTTFALRDGRLVRLTAGGAEQPVADHVAAFGASLTPGRLDLRVTLEPASQVAAPLDLRTSVGFRR